MQVDIHCWSWESFPNLKNLTELTFTLFSRTVSNVTPTEVLEAMKVVRPELESVIASSSKCFFLSTSEEKGESTQGGTTDDLAVCDLDESGATREEQALAWARCSSTSGKKATNYLTSTVRWVFQTEKEEEVAAIEDAIPMEVLERRLRGANIKPSNRLIAAA